MPYRRPSLSAIAGAALVGLVFAMVGLQTLAGCGTGGRCLRAADFVPPSQRHLLLAER